MIQKEWRTISISAIILLICVACFIPFLEFHEHRADELNILFDDPILKILPFMDLSILIFSVTYGSIVLYCILNYRVKHFLSILMLTYAIIVLLRMVSMTLVPLKEPVDLVYLHDPFLNNLIYPGRIDTDLFFSGHTALLMAFFFISKHRWIFLFLACILGLLLMVQRVHYSIDIIGAVPFAFLATKISKWIVRRWY
jgi:hypothetical protein